MAWSLSSQVRRRSGFALAAMAWCRNRFGGQGNLHRLHHNLISEAIDPHSPWLRQRFPFGKALSYGTKAAEGGKLQARWLLNDTLALERHVFVCVCN